MSTIGVDLLGNLPDWQDRALCAQTDPEAFFVEKGASTDPAKRICNRCEVKAECLEYALAEDIRFGVWGGLSERERRRLKRGAGVGRLADDAQLDSPDSPELVEAVGRMAADGKGDSEIGRLLRLSTDRVRGVRNRNEIPAGRSAKRSGPPIRRRRKPQPVAGGIR